MSEREYIEGVKLIVGRLRGQSTTTVQSVLFDRDKWTMGAATSWLRDHDFKARYDGKSADKTENNYRFRQRDPGEFEDGSIRTVSAGKMSQAKEFAVEGVTLIAGTLRDQDIQQLYGVRFDKAAGWDFLDACIWLKRHGFWCYGGAPGEYGAYLGSIPFIDDEGSITILLAHKTMFEGEFREMPVTSENARRFANDLMDAAHEYDARRSGDDADVNDYATKRAGKGLYEITDVEIFRTGKWKGDAYDERDLDDMVAAFDKAGFRPPIKLGHAEKSGDPAYGWIKALRRNGDRLVADFMDVPKKLFDAIKNRAFDAVSSEIFWNVERGGKKFRRVLKAVALLGAETPAVADLKPIRESFAAALSLGDAEFERVVTCTVGVDDEMTKTIQERDEQIAALTAERDALGAKLKAADVKSDEAKKLSADLEAKDAEVEAAQAERDEAIRAKDAEIAKLTAANDRMEKRMAAFEAERAKEREAARRAMIDARVEKLSIPVLKEPLRHLYDMATGAADAERKYSYTVAEDKDPVELSGVELVDKLVATLQDKFKNVLAEHADTGGGKRHDTPPVSEMTFSEASVEVDKRAKVYMAEHDGVKYDAAMRAVLDADAELKTAYTASR